MTHKDEVYDKDVMGSSQIRKTGGETIGKDRKQPASMTRRMKAVGGGKMEPVKSPARRKDAGQQKPKSQTQQQPTKKEVVPKLNSHMRIR